MLLYFGNYCTSSFVRNDTQKAGKGNSNIIYEKKLLFSFKIKFNLRINTFSKGKKLLNEKHNDQIRKINEDVTTES